MMSEYWTEDKLLDGRVTVLHPRHGYRVAIDPVLLAAAVPLAVLPMLSPAQTLPQRTAGCVRPVEMRSRPFSFSRVKISAADDLREEVGMVWGC